MPIGTWAGSFGDVFVIVTCFEGWNMLCRRPPAWWLTLAYVVMASILSCWLCSVWRNGRRECPLFAAVEQILFVQRKRWYLHWLHVLHLGFGFLIHHWDIVISVKAQFLPFRPIWNKDADTTVLPRFISRDQPTIIKVKYYRCDELLSRPRK
jgi:hypothetical protein